jgi:hypothetical protein
VGGYVGNCAGVVEVLLSGALDTAIADAAPATSRILVQLQGSGALLGASLRGLGPGLSAVGGARIAFGAPGTYSRPGRVFLADLIVNVANGDSILLNVVAVGGILENIDGELFEETGNRFGLTIGQ